MKPLLSAFLLMGMSLAAADVLVQDGDRVAFLGDSITQFGWEHPGGYVRLVASGLQEAGVKIAPVPAGVSGNTSRDMLARVDGAVVAKQPAWMTLSCGVNDVWHGATGVDLETYKKNIAEIVDRAQAKGIKVMVLTSTPIGMTDNPNNDRLAAYNDFLRQFAAERKLSLADLNAAMWDALKAAPDKPLTVDGVHMNVYGDTVMAAGILKAFGLSPEAVAKARERWRNAPDAAYVSSHFAVQGLAPLSLGDYEALQRLAAAQKARAEQIVDPLYFQAVRAVFKAHADDADFAAGPAQKEIADEFGRQLAAYLKTHPNP